MRKSRSPRDLKRSSRVSAERVAEIKGIINNNSNQIKEEYKQKLRQFYFMIGVTKENHVCDCCVFSVDNKEES